MSENSDHRLRITLRQLEVFAATARAGSTRAAAGQVARSQSAASAALGDLEETLGIHLFDRVGRRLILNESGRALLPMVISLVEQAGALESLLLSDRAVPLRLASSYTIGEYVLPSLIASWKQQNHASKVQLNIANTHNVLEAVASFDADLGFIEGTGSHPDLQVRRWRNDELVVFAAAHHPLGRQRATAKRLTEASWILRERGSGTREAADRWLQAHLDHYDVGMELGSNEAVKRCVACGLGLGCLSSLAVEGALGEGWLVEVRSPFPAMRRSLSIVLHRGKPMTSVAEDFLRHCFAAGPLPDSRGAPMARAASRRTEVVKPRPT